MNEYENNIIGTMKNQDPTTDKKIFNSIKNFRNNATPEDMEKLEIYINSQSNKAKAFPTEVYHFSYSAAAQFLREKGYLGGITEEPKENNKPEFAIRVSDKQNNFVSRSFSIQEELLQRFDEMSNVYWQYSKKAIINVLINEALSKYGF